MMADSGTTHADRLQLAMSLGLTPHEARSFIALLEQGESKASQISKASGVPRARIYVVLESLHAKGLVAVVPAKPLRYRPVSLDAIVEHRRDELRAAEDDLERNASRLVSQVTPRPMPVPPGEFLLFRKRQAVLRKFREMILGARKEIVVSASEMCTVRGTRALLDAYRERAEAGVAVKVSTRITAQSRADVARYRPQIDVRHTDLGNRATSIVVVDHREVFIVHWNPDDDSILSGDDAGIWSTNPGVVDSFHTIATNAWDRGIPADVVLAEPEEPERPEAA